MADIRWSAVLLSLKSSSIGEFFEEPEGLASVFFVYGLNSEAGMNEDVVAQLNFGDEREDDATLNSSEVSDTRISINRNQLAWYR